MSCYFGGRILVGGGKYSITQLNRLTVTGVGRAERSADQPVEGVIRDELDMDMGYGICEKIHLTVHCSSRERERERGRVAGEGKTRQRGESTIYLLYYRLYYLIQ